MSFTKTTVKYTLYIFNLLIFISALALIIVGAVYINKSKDVSNILGESYAVSNIFIVLVGLVIFVISFLGCCGAIRENQCLLITYSAILITFLLIQIAAGSYAFLEVKNNEDLNNTIHTKLDSALKRYYDDKSNQAAFDAIQSNIRCCGVDGPYDWTRNGTEVPKSCCYEVNICTPLNSYQEGCANKLYYNIKESATDIGYMALLLCGIEFVPAVLALILKASI